MGYGVAIVDDVVHECAPISTQTITSSEVNLIGQHAQVAQITLVFLMGNTVSGDHEENGSWSSSQEKEEVDSSLPPKFTQEVNVSIPSEEKVNVSIPSQEKVNVPISSQEKVKVS